MIQDYKQINLYGKKIFEKAVVSPPFRFFYSMPDEACFFYLLKGTNAVYAPTEQRYVNREEGVVMQCGSYFCDVLASDDSEFCEAIAVHLPLEVLRMIYDKEFPDFMLKVNEVEPLQLEKYESSALLKSYIDNLQFYFDNPSLVTEEILKLKLKELILILAKTDNAETVKQILAGLFSRVEVEFKAVIEANLYNNFSVEELAKLTHLSLSSFKREFQKQYGTSPAKYIKEQKLKKAAKLLSASDLRVSSIAFDCGFSDLAHFSRSFQRVYGSSPSDFRLTARDKSLS